MDIRVDEFQGPVSDSGRRGEGRSVELAREAGLADGIGLLRRGEPQARDQVALQQCAHSLEVEVGEATMPEGLIEREGGGGRHLRRFEGRDDLASEERGVGAVYGRTEQSLAISNEIHGGGRDVDIEGAFSSEIQHREEIGAKLRDMKNSSELHRPHDLSPDLWSEHHRPYARAEDNRVVG